MGSTHSNTHTTSRKPHHSRRKRLAVIAAVTAFGLGACGGDDDASSEASAQAETDDSANSMELNTGDFEGADGATEDQAAAEESAPATGGVAASGLPINDFNRDIITNVGLTIASPDVGRTADDIRRLAGDNGGAVFRSDIAIEETREDGSVPGGGQIVVRIPPQDLDRLVQALDGVGSVSRLTQDSEDVTDLLVDLEIRIRQAETGIERIEELLENATELDDVFAIETELADRLIRLEQLRAGERNTEDLVALATLTVDVQYRAPDSPLLEDETTSDGIGDAFADGWDAFVGAVFAVGYVLAISAPFLLTILLVLGIAWLLGRRWNRRRAAVREERRLAADRVGHLPGAAAAVSAPTSRPAPPVAAQRSPDGAHRSTPAAGGTDTIVADGSDHVDDRNDG